MNEEKKRLKGNDTDKKLLSFLNGDNSMII